MIRHFVLALAGLLALAPLAAQAQSVPVQGSVVFAGPAGNDSKPTAKVLAPSTSSAGYALCSGGPGADLYWCVPQASVAVASVAGRTGAVVIGGPDISPSAGPIVLTANRVDAPSIRATSQASGTMPQMVWSYPTNGTGLKLWAEYVNSGGDFCLAARDDSSTTKNQPFCVHKNADGSASAFDLSVPITATGISLPIWTPGVTFGGTAASCSTCSGRYYQVGKLVVATFDITLSSKNAGGTMLVTGLPLTSNGTQGAAVTLAYFNNLKGLYGPPMGYVTPGGSTIQLMTMPSSCSSDCSPSNLTDGNAENSTTIRGTATYLIP